MIILQILVITFYILKSLDFVYLFQIKEYRLDRILSFFKEENLFKLLYQRIPRLPAKSLRNFFIVQGIAFNTVPLYLLLQNLNWFLTVLILILTPFLALLTMLLGIVLTEIPVQIYRKILITKAKQKVKDSKTIFIGITGSYGKTSVKEFLYQILSQQFKASKTEKNINSDIGIAISVLKNLKKDTQFFIVEIGAYKKGEIKSVCEIIRPKYAILTGIGNQHLALFGSKRNLIEAKTELLQAVSKDGIVYINKDIQRVEEIAKKTSAKKIYFSTRQKADIFLKSYKEENNMTKSEIILNDVSWIIETHLLGIHNLQNLLPCIAIASDLGIEKEKIIKAINDLNPIKGRLSLEKGPNDSTILDDSYNSNVEGFLASIEVTNSMEQRNKIIISRGLIELGSEKKSSYQRIVDKLHKTNLNLLTTDELFKRFDSNNHVLTFNSEAKLLDYLLKISDKETLVLIEGRFESRTLSMILANSQHLH